MGPHSGKAVLGPQPAQDIVSDRKEPKVALEIRDAVSGDEAEWRALWDQYLAYYNVDLDPEVTTRTWARILDPLATLAGRIALIDGKIAGFALHLHHSSTWVMGDDCYLEDLFVLPQRRGAGVGRALIEDLIALARNRGWHRLYWHTDTDNHAARRLYDSFVPTDGHIRYRLTL